MVNKKEKFTYPVYSARTEQEIKDWLKDESLKYKSPNLFFKELKYRYGLVELQNKKKQHHK